jgi:glutaredoxin 3
MTVETRAGAVDHAGNGTSNRTRKRMAVVTIYTTTACVFCLRAKEFLRSRGVSFREVDVSGDDDARERLIEQSNGRRTVPQIFVGDVHVGGYTDLVALDRDGKLRPLLAAS